MFHPNMVSLPCIRMKHGFFIRATTLLAVISGWLLCTFPERGMDECAAVARDRNRCGMANARSDSFGWGGVVVVHLSLHVALLHSTLAPRTNPFWNAGELVHFLRWLVGIPGFQWEPCCHWLDVLIRNIWIVEESLCSNAISFASSESKVGYLVLGYLRWFLYGWMYAMYSFADNVRVVWIIEWENAMHFHIIFLADYKLTFEDHS